MTSATLLQRITDFANRANPYPLYAELRRTPVARQNDGSYLVGGYYEVRSLVCDPRISSDARNLVAQGGEGLKTEEEAGLPPSMLRLDPPDHDRLRRMAMRPFGPPHTPRRVHELRGELARIIAGLIDDLEDKGRFDLVDEFSYPFPVTVICRLLGVPHEDEPRFRVWADDLVSGADPSPGPDLPERMRKGQQARVEMGRYLAALAEEHGRNPGDDLLSGLATDHGPDGQMSITEIMSTAVLLLVAGHETTVNLITNGMLTLLRYPEHLERLVKEPDVVVPMVEELLRYEPPVQLALPRVTLADIDIADVVIPRGSSLWLGLASANRDSRRFEDPDRFDPDRRDNQHLGFLGGIHYCFGAPLARTEGQIALTELARRLVNPRLVEDPPPYRPNPLLRGPRHLPVAIDGVRS